MRSGTEVCSGGVALTSLPAGFLGPDIDQADTERRAVAGDVDTILPLTPSGATRYRALLIKFPNKSLIPVIGQLIIHIEITTG